MEKIVAGGAQYVTYIALLAGVLITVIVGVMSILLPILVFRILSEVSEMNKKMSKIIMLLSEEAKESRVAQNPRQTEEVRLGPFLSKKGGLPALGEKPLRFQ